MKEEKFYKKIDKIAQKIGQSRAGRTLATKVYQLTKVSYSSCPSNTSTQPIMDKSVSALILSIESVDEIISKTNEVAKIVDEYEEVKNMSGVGNRLVQY